MLVEVVHRCLAKDPARRHPDAHQLLAHLQSAARAVEWRRRVRVSGSVAAAAGALVALVALGLLTTSARSAAPSLDPQLLIVLPFDAAVVDPSVSGLGRQVAITLSTSLDGVGELRSVDGATVLARSRAWASGAVLASGLDLARELGAGRVVHGVLAKSGDYVRTDVSIYRTADGVLEGRTSAAAPVADISALTDSITWALFQSVWTSERVQFEPGALATRSLTALRAFLDGEIAMAEGRWRQAPDLFAHAFEVDSSFWLAYWRYATARAYRAQPVEQQVHDIVWEHRFELPERERALIEASSPDSLSDRLARLRELTLRYADSWRAWFALADVLIHDAMRLGTTVTEARVAIERAVALHPASSTLWMHLFWMALADDDTAAMRHAVQRMQSLSFDSASTLERGVDVLGLYRGLHQLALRDGAPSSRLGAAMADGLVRYTGPLDLDDLFGDLSVFGFPRAELALSQAALDRPVPSSARAGALRATAQAFAARGAWDSTVVALQRYVARVDGNTPLQHAWRLAVVGAWLGVLETGTGAQWRAALEREMTRLDPHHRAELDWLDGIAAHARADTSALDRARARLADAAVPEALPLSRSLDAFALALRGDVVAAADSIVEIERHRAEHAALRAAESWHPYLTAVNRIAAGDWLLAANRPADAARLLRWHESVQTSSIVGRAEATLRGVVLYRRARADQALGRTDAARSLYRRMLREVDLPVARLQPLADSARAATSRR